MPQARSGSGKIWACVALVAALAVGAGVGGDPVRRVGPRLVPPPDLASEWIRERVAATAQLDPREAAPQTAEEWRGLIAARDAASGRYAANLAARTGVAVSQDNIAGVPVYRVRPARPAEAYAGRLFVNVHGGAWAFGGGPAAAIEAIMIAAKIGVEAVAIDYRRPPDHPFPAALDDVVAVWGALAASRPAAGMALGGTSAGGNLSLAATRRILDLGLPAPGALMIGTPVIDLSKTGDSRFVNDGVDNVLAWDGLIAGAAALYAGGRSLADPALSPVHADMKGFPPTYLISGSRDLLLSDTIVAHRMLRRAGAIADLHVYEGMSHSDYLRTFGSPESDEHFSELDAFLQRHLSR